MAADETPLPRYFVPGKRKNDAPIFQSDADVLVIGTGSDATFRVDDPMAARLHLKFVYENGLFRVEDLGSALGTYVNGLPVDGVLPLNDGDEVVFGVSRITVGIPDAEGSADSMSLALKEKSFHFVEKGKGENLADLYRWVRSEVTFGRFENLNKANWIAGGFGLLAIALLAVGVFREWLAEPGALHATHAGLFGDVSDDVRQNFPDEVALAAEQGCNACHDPFGNTPLDKCAGCHESMMGEQHPFNVLAKPEAGWGEFACVQCHVDHTGSERWSFTPDVEFTKQSCELCHGDELPAVEKPAIAPTGTRSVDIVYDTFPHDEHLAFESPTDGRKMTCEVCHEAKPSDEVYSFTASIRRDFEPVAFETCQRCHAGERAPEGRDPALGDFFSETRFNTTWHGTDNDGAGCLKCHATTFEADLAREETTVAGVNGMADLALEFTVTRFDHDGIFEQSADTCSECHADGSVSPTPQAVGTFWHGLHMTSLYPGDDVAKARELSGDCVSCHAGLAEATALGSDDFRGSQGQCTQCHESGEPQPAVSERVERTRPRFPHDVHVAAIQAGSSTVLERGCFACHEFTEPDDAFSALPATLGTVTDNCLDCHAEHDWVGGSEDGCSSCHPKDDPVWTDTKIAKDWPLASTFDHHSPGHATDTQREGAPTCATCHSLDEPQAGVPSILTAKTILEVPIPTEDLQSCRECHVKSRERYHWR